MDLCYELCLAGWLSCVAKNLTLDITRKLFNQICLYFTVLIDTIDFCHFRPFHRPWPCLGSGWTLMWRWSNSSWRSWEHFGVTFFETRETAAFLLTVSNNFNVCTHLDIFWLVWFKLSILILLCSTCCHQSNWSWLKVTGVWESKNFCANCLAKFSVHLNRIWFDNVMNLLLILSSIWYSRERTLLIWLYLEDITLACIHILFKIS